MDENGQPAPPGTNSEAVFQKNPTGKLIVERCRFHAHWIGIDKVAHPTTALWRWTLLAAAR